MASFPFTAVVGQDLVKTALLLAIVEPGTDGVLISGSRGSAQVDAGQEHRGTGRGSSAGNPAARRQRVNVGWNAATAAGTDGRVRGGVERRSANLERAWTTVVDIELGNFRLGRSHYLARALRADYLHVEALDAPPPRG